jgi:hypothetical protein
MIDVERFIMHLEFADHDIPRRTGEDFDQGQVLKVAVERREWAFGRLLDRMDREFASDASGPADTFTYPFGELDVLPRAPSFPLWAMPITGLPDCNSQSL